MKVRSVSIRNFRGIKELDLDFVDPRTGNVRDLTCLIGDNGSGKTTALQAIAWAFGVASGRFSLGMELDWNGFIFERVASMGTTSVNVQVEFLKTELDVLDAYAGAQNIDRTAHAFSFTIGSETAKIPSPVCLYHKYRRIPGLTASQEPLGDVYWFDQYRNLATRIERSEVASTRRADWQTGIEQLREFLVGMWGFHTSPEPKQGIDYISELEPRFSEIFPNTKFRGIAPRATGMRMKASDFYFLIERGGRIFDMSEMASGEQVVFALLFEFVRLRIKHSVVLIDELELHLHPPQQQALLGMLNVIGPDCQFIITTHSPYLTDIIPDEQEIRLPGGRPCL